MIRTKKQPRCTEPNAAVTSCAVCGVDVHTCENPNGWTDKRCPAHPEGVEMRDGKWVCSDECYSRRCLDMETER